MTVWLVRNRHTGIVVSRWLDEASAWADKDKRDAKWPDLEPQSALEVVRADE